MSYAGYYSTLPEQRWYVPIAFVISIPKHFLYEIAWLQSVVLCRKLTTWLCKYISTFIVEVLPNDDAGDENIE
jgi:hypothetical protein